jgi:hypothetical protein
MAIRNVAVQKADPNKRASYGITNVNTERRAANDNKPASGRPSFTPPSANDNRPSKNLVGQTREIATKVVATANATSATWLIIGLTWILYLIQLVFAAISLIGLGAVMAFGGSWLDFVDFLDLLSEGSELFFYLGIGMTLVVGVLTFLFAILVFMFRGVVITKSLSIIVAAVCFSLYLAPGVNLVPWAWIWCLYVVKTQSTR